MIPFKKISKLLGMRRVISQKRRPRNQSVLIGVISIMRITIRMMKFGWIRLKDSTKKYKKYKPWFHKTAGNLKKKYLQDEI